MERPSICLIFSLLDCVYAFLPRTPQKWYFVFSVYCVRRHVMFIYLITGDVNHTFIKCGFFHVSSLWSLLSFFLINKYVVRRYCAGENYADILSTLLSIPLVCINDSYLQEHYCDVCQVVSQYYHHSFYTN